jgi:hypothetical protein
MLSRFDRVIAGAGTSARETRIGSCTARVSAQFECATISPAVIVGQLGPVIPSDWASARNGSFRGVAAAHAPKHSAAIIAIKKLALGHVRIIFVESHAQDCPQSHSLPNNQEGRGGGN